MGGGRAGAIKGGKWTTGAVGGVGVYCVVGGVVCIVVGAVGG